MSLLDETPASSAAPAVIEETMPAILAPFVPAVQHEEFWRKTTPETRARLASLLEIFHEIAHGPAGVVATVNRIALERQGRGLGKANLLRLYGLWKKNRDWRQLIPAHRNGSAGLPAEFIQYLRMKDEQNKRERSGKTVFAQLHAAWAAGESIPGYGTWREYHATHFPERDLPERYPFGFFPPGWQKSNLYTKLATEAERKMAKRGMASAKRHLPHVIRDTSALRFMELITIDDFETDIMVQARNPRTGRYEIVTCTGLVALDVATRTRLSLGLKPRFKDEEGKRQAITRADVQFMLHDIFATHGLPKDWGVTILCENASAAISDDLADMLEALLGVQIGRTGMLADKVLANGFVPKGGKPWEKGWIESAYHLMANYAGGFTGQKGASYQLKPDDFEARLLYAENLLDTEGLSPEQLAQLHTGFWHYDEALTAYTRIWDAMEARTDHRMQGFEEVRDYELPGRPGLLTEAEARMLPRAEVCTLTTVPRRESPRERKTRLLAETARVKVADHALALLLLTPKRCTLKNLRVTFTHLGEGFTFSEAGSPVLALPEGTELLGYFDPAKPDRLFACRTDGRYVGAVRRRGAVNIADAEAIAKERGEITAIITQHVLEPIRARHGEEDRALAAMKAENAAKLAEWGAAAPNPDNGHKRRDAVSAQLAAATPGAQPRHAATAASLAAGVAEAGRDETRQLTRKATEKALQHDDSFDAGQLL